MTMAKYNNNNDADNDCNNGDVMYMINTPTTNVLFDYYHHHDNNHHHGCWPTHHRHRLSPWLCHCGLNESQLERRQQLPRKSNTSSSSSSVIVDHINMTSECNHSTISLRLKLKCLLQFIILIMMTTTMVDASRRHWSSSSQSMMGSSSSNGYYNGEHSLRHHRGMCVCIAHFNHYSMLLETKHEASRP